MVKIKICGVKSTSDIEAVNIAKPDYTGFVFAKSKRQITLDKALTLKEKLDKDILAAGVFVDMDMDFIVKCAKSCVIDIIQLHGSEDEEYIQKIKDLTKKPVIKAVAAESFYDIQRLQNTLADYVLFDAKTPGSGKSFDWSIISGFKKKFFLAGGLNIDNIEDAIKKTKPYATDISSGVETSGVKDFDKIVEIVKRVKNAK